MDIALGCGRPKSARCVDRALNVARSLGRASEVMIQIMQHQIISTDDGRICKIRLSLSSVCLSSVHHKSIEQHAVTAQFLRFACTHPITRLIAEQIRHLHSRINNGKACVCGAERQRQEHIKSVGEAKPDPANLLAYNYHATNPLSHIARLPGEAQALAFKSDNTVSNIPRLKNTTYIILH